MTGKGLSRGTQGRRAHHTPEVTADFGRRELVGTRGITEVAGARRLLQTLSDSQVAIVTSAPRALAEVRLAVAGIPVPEVLVCREDVVRGKPDPEGYESAARRLRVAPGSSAATIRRPRVRCRVSNRPPPTTDSSAVMTSIVTLRLFRNHVIRTPGGVGPGQRRAAAAAQDLVARRDPQLSP